MEIKDVKLMDVLTLKKDYLDYFNEIEGSEWTLDKVERRMKQLVKRFDYIGKGIYLEHKLIGFALGQIEQFDDGLVVRLNELFMIKEEQSKGYGTKLLNEFEQYAKDKGCFLIQLETANDTSHHRFYNEINSYKDANNNILKSKIIE